MKKKILYSITALLVISAGFMLTKLNQPKGQGFAPSSGYDKKITLFLDTSSATINVSSINDSDGMPLALSSSNSGYFTIDPGIDGKAERIVCTGATGVTLTGCTRGLPADGSVLTGSSTLARTHSIGARIIMSNISQFYGNYVNIWDAQNIAGIKTLASRWKMSTSTPTTQDTIATIYDIQQATTTGGVDAQELIKGVVQLATKADMILGTDIGSTLTRLVIPNKMASSSNDVATTSVVITQPTGLINPNFYQSNVNVWGATNTFSGRILNNTNIITLTSSTTITGASTPQPVYIATSTGTLKLCDANDDSTFYDFIGFAISDASNGSSTYVQYDGIVSGFTGLTIGAEYYASNTAGIISTTKGDTPMRLGKAISATQLIIDRKRTSSAIGSIVDGTTYYAYTDVFVTMWKQEASYVECYIDGTIIEKNHSTTAGDDFAGCSMLVPQGHTYKATAASGGGSGYIIKYW